MVKEESICILAKTHRTLGWKRHKNSRHLQQISPQRTRESILIRVQQDASQTQTDYNRRQTAQTRQTNQNQNRRLSLDKRTSQTRIGTQTNLSKMTNIAQTLGHLARRPGN